MNLKKEKNKLTERQKEILNFISDFCTENGYSPSYREIGANFSIASTFGVKRHIDALVKKGFLEVGSNISRSLTIVNQQPGNNNKTNEKIPLVGRVAAGYPILAEENIEDYLTIDPQLIIKANNCFALKVRGDSMINAGIFEDDIVIISQQPNAKNNDIIVALLGDEATLKRFITINNRICLMPENENYPLIEVHNRADFKILGKLIALIRKY